MQSTRPAPQIIDTNEHSAQTTAPEMGRLLMFDSAGNSVVLLDLKNENKYQYLVTCRVKLGDSELFGQSKIVHYITKLFTISNSRFMNQIGKLISAKWFTF
jgi:hypothetical protein